MTIHLCVLICFVASCVPVESLFAQESYKRFELNEISNTDIRGLEAGIEAWRRSLTFTCSYEYRSGYSLSFENAKNGAWFVKGELKDKDLDPRRSTGRMVKLGDNMRFSAIFESGSDVRPKTGVTYFSSKDIVQTSNMIVEFIPSQESIHFKNGATNEPRVQFWPMTGTTPRRILMDRTPLNIPNPFFSAGGNSGTLMSNIDVRPKLGESFTLNCRNSKNELTVFIKVVNAKQKLIRSYEFQFNLDSTVPCLKYYRFKGLSKGGELICDHAIFFAEFKDCGNGFLIASKLVEVVGPLKRAAGKLLDRPYFAGRIWKSTDIGNKQPTKDDFTIKLPAGTKWNNYSLKEGSVSKTSNTVNALEIDHRRIVSPTETTIWADDTDIPKGVENNGSAAQTSSTVPIIFLLVSAFFCLAVGVRLFKFQKDKN